MLEELLKTDARARKVFGRKEMEIILKQLGGSMLTQSERNRLSRDIKPKLAFIREAARFESEFALKKNQSSKRMIKKAVNAMLQDKLKDGMAAILLFGSFASNTFTALSDIDICVVFKKDMPLKEATQFRIRIAGQLPDKVDVQVFNTLPQKIKKEIAANHKVLYRSGSYDNIDFTLKHLKDDGYFIRMRKMFGEAA